MSLEIMSRDVQAKIESFREEEFNRIGSELTELERESNERIESFKLSLTSKNRKEINSKKISILGVAKSEAKSTLLKSQKEVFETLEDNVLNYFNTLKGKELGDFYKHLMKRAEEVIPVGLIKCSKSDKALVEKIAKKGLKVEFSDLIKKGLIFESSDNTESLDLRVEILLKTSLKDSEDEIMSLLLK